MSTSPTARDVVLVGAGPRALSILERLVASVPDLRPDEPLRIHLVDPFPPGAGRIWRQEQSTLLWMNSMTADVTVFADETTPTEGPVVPGPSLWEWIESVGGTLPTDSPVGRESRAASPAWFASRTLQSDYLAWVLHRTLESAPDNVEVRVHPARAIDVRRSDGVDVVVLDDGTLLRADAVVLAQGHLEVEATLEERAHAAFAERHGLVHVGSGYTADLDLSAVLAGETVLVRGLGLAFVDLVVLLTEGRGGRYVEEGGRLRYVASGREPLLVAGSRRGVPYRSKLGYAHPGPSVALPSYLTVDAVRSVTGGGVVTSFRDQVWPLLVKDLARAHYAQLFAAHPDRTVAPWEDVAAALDAHPWGSPALATVLEDAVPKSEDRFDLDGLDRPLDRLRFDGIASLQGVLRDHIAADHGRRHDPEHSSDSAVFTALLYAYGALGALASHGLLSPATVAHEVEHVWHNFFSYVASGPPGVRLRQLLALSDAGIVTFLGAGATFDADDERGVFVGRSTSHDDEVVARAFVDARLPDASVLRSTDTLTRSLLERGELTDVVTGADGVAVHTGKVQARPTDQRLLRRDGSVSASRFALGPWVTGGAASAAFARPRTGAGFFRLNDAVARAVLRQIAGDQS